MFETLYPPQIINLVGSGDLNVQNTQAAVCVLAASLA